MIPENSSRETEYLVFNEVKTKGSTRMWVVESKRSGDALGIIQWYGAWRQYVIQAEAIFNKGCLEDINKFLADAMDDWRERKAREDSADGSANRKDQDADRLGPARPGEPRGALP